MTPQQTATRICPRFSPHVTARQLASDDSDREINRGATQTSGGHPPAQMIGSWSLLSLSLAWSFLFTACPDPLPEDPQGGTDLAGETAGDSNNAGNVGGSAGTFALDLGVDMGGEELAGAQVMSPEGLCQLCGEDGSPCPETLSCFTHPESAEEFCSIQCESDEECPTEYRCMETSRLTDNTSENLDEQPELVNVCVPTDRCTPELCRDDDGDGYGRGPDCLGLDCNENDVEVHEGVTVDLCDNIDNDCDGLTDESFMPESCGEGSCSGLSVCEGGRVRCDGPMPSGEDANCDAVDDDCDGATDEGYQPLNCGLGACTQPSVCDGGVEMCMGSAPPIGDADQVCDRVDSDCDGVIDEGFIVNSSICGLGVCAARGTCTDEGEVCTPRPQLGDDADCNGSDDDCDGQVDEGYTSALSCGFGACRALQTCAEGEPICIEGAPNNEDDADCNGVDDNCDGIVDNRCASNEFSFSLISSSEEHLEIAVIFSRGAETDLNITTLPYFLELRFSHPDTLSAPVFTSGPSLTEAGFVFPVTDRDSSDSERVRMLLPPGIPPIEYEYMLPGELVRIRFTKATDALGPFNFTWVSPEPYTDENNNNRYDFGESYVDVNNDQQRNGNSTLTPIEADEIILLTDAQFGDL